MPRRGVGKRTPPDRSPGGRHTEMASTSAGNGRRLLLVGWDGADWKLITPLLDRGELPCLNALIDRGVMGKLSSAAPLVSPLLWTSLATGKRADKHGIVT